MFDFWMNNSCICTSRYYVCSSRCWHMEAERVQKDRSLNLVNDWLLHIHIEIYKFNLVIDESSNERLCSRCACSSPDRDRLLYCCDLGTKWPPLHHGAVIRALRTQRNQPLGMRPLFNMAERKYTPKNQLPATFAT